jgi:TRAP-type uncharacterized transport system fused permease subunit
VSPPTALSPFAAAAITGGDPYKTTLQSWKYTMPAFLVPFVFVLDPLGIGLLLKFAEGATWLDIVEITLQVGAGIALLAFAFQRHYRLRTNGVETGLFAVAGILLVLPTVVAAMLKPIIGIDISGYMPLFPQLGLHIGYNVVMAVALFVVAHTMQRTRSAALAPSG